MADLLLPKISELETESEITKRIYLNSQSNDFIDPLSEGAAVFLNYGADRLLQKHSSNACWFGMYKSTLAKGGLDGRLGIVTQYHDNDSVRNASLYVGAQIAPWVRISCFLDSIDYKISYIGSVSIDARFCTTVPMTMYQNTQSGIQRKHQTEMERLASHLAKY